MTLKISVIGTGYLGATHAACIASFGFNVVGVDIDSQKIASLARGEIPFYEPGLADLLADQVTSQRLKFTSNFPLIADCDVHFLCVGTPQVEDGLAADLTYVEEALETVASYAKDGALIVGKSTVPVGTAARLRARLQEINPTLDLAWNPEFLREGFAVEDTLHPNRLVVGVTNDRAEQILREVYSINILENVPWVRADLATTELVKAAANSFLATKISFINAMAEICEASGGDVTVLARAIGYDPRIGDRFLQAGVGFGGGCLPKDIRAFMARAEELGLGKSLRFLQEIDLINLRARRRVVDMVCRELSNDLHGKRVSILGVAFKPESDDVRDSPALDVAIQIHAAGAQVFMHDPQVSKLIANQYPFLNFAQSVESCVSGADAVVHLTEWKMYRDLDPIDLKAIVSQAIMIDGRNALDRELWIAAGWTFKALGR